MVFSPVDTKEKWLKLFFKFAGYIWINISPQILMVTTTDFFIQKDFLLISEESRSPVLQTRTILDTDFAV